MENKVELVLEGLNCANCAAKIETKVSELESIDSCNLNFVNKTLTITTDQDNTKITNEIKAIVKKIEDHVEVVNKSNYKELRIDGLDCAVCATNVQNGICTIDGIHNVNVDFFNKKITFNYDQHQNINTIINSIKQRSTEIESDVVITEELVDSEDVIINKNNLILLIIGSLLYLSLFFVDIKHVLELALYIIAYLLVGYDVINKAVKNILRGKLFDEFFLMTIATIGAFFIGEYPEAVAVMVFYKVGELFQDLAVNKSRRSIKSLLNIKPEFANVLRLGEYQKVSPDDVEINEEIIVKPGEKVPLDGIVLAGETTVDTKVLTGESLVRDIYVNDEVLSGFINMSGVIKVKVTKIASESTVSKVIELVQDATSKKAKTERFMTKFAQVYTPAVVIIAVLIATLMPIILDQPFIDWLYRSLVFLVISCPCALVISIPLSYFGGIGAASRKGVLVKGSNYLEALENVDTIVFDKTGTLTTGNLKVTEIKSNVLNSNELLRIVALGEYYSNHPLAKAILEVYQGEMDYKEVSDFKEDAGFGISYRYNNNLYLVGNKKQMEKNNVRYIENESVGSILYVARNNDFIGSIVIKDQIKNESSQTIKALKEMGKEVVMLTGDTIAVASEVQSILGIDTVFSELLPHEKVNQIEALKNKGRSIAFVGDGINDAPAIALADVGFAMGGLGSDAAIEVADIVITNDDVAKVVSAIQVAHQTKRIVWQNIFFSLGTKFLVLLLGVFGIASLWEAVFADVGVALIAILNSMRILRK